MYGLQHTHLTYLTKFYMPIGSYYPKFTFDKIVFHYLILSKVITCIARCSFLVSISAKIILISASLGGACCSGAAADLGLSGGD